MCADHKKWLSVRVAVDDPSLRARLIRIVEGARLTAAGTAEGETLAIIADGDVEDSSVPEICLWSLPRYRRIQAEQPSPFTTSKVVAWIGTLPDLDDQSVHSALEHLATGRFRGMADLLSPGARTLSVLERSSTRKHHHLERLREFFAPAAPSAHVQNALELALEELYTNAVYNAPVDATGRPLNAHQGRATAVESPQPFSVRFGCDDELAVVGVGDAYGTLSPTRLRDCVRRCYAPSGAVYEDKRGGAGLGMFMILQEATRLIVNIKAGQFTEVLFARRLKERRRAFAQSCPTLSVCAVEGAQAVNTSRAYPRMAVRQQATARWGGRTVPVTLLDLSQGGAFLVVGDDHLPLPGERIDIYATAGGGGCKHLAATVRWAGSSNVHLCPGAGVQFDRLLELDELAGLGAGSAA